MVRRLVLGSGSGGRTVLSRLVSEAGELYAVVPERSQMEALRDDTVDARRGDPADPKHYPSTVDSVIVVGDDPGTNRRAATTAREQFPDALLVAYTGVDADAEAVAALERVADRVVDRTAVLAGAVTGVVGDTAGDRIRKLLRVLRSLDGRLAVVTHDNPDPDAIASALALVRIAESVGVRADPVYFGDISHQENRALVNLLDLDLRSLGEGTEEALAEYGGVALVDHSRPGVNDGLDPGTTVDIVVDHHPPRAPVEARFVDLRSGVGSTSTLLADYLEHLGIEPSRTLASALLYGIRIDTRDFTRECSRADYEAAAFLLPHVDADTLERVESPSMSAEVLETLARAIRNRDRREAVLVTGVGRIRDRDALAQAADVLLDMEGVCVTLVYGYRDDTVYVSGRARGTDLDLGETLREALGSIGSAGGHADMAGAQIPLGILGAVGDDEATEADLRRVVDSLVGGRFFEVLEHAPSAPSMDGDDTEITFEFPLEE
jgi:nanoRNase/pAp phosphatase (c-di-AMP/oligoRNAs hydrolase)